VRRRASRPAADRRHQLTFLSQARCGPVHVRRSPPAPSMPSSAS
jgi:hypothetical protein